MTKWCEAAKASCRAKHLERNGIPANRDKLIKALYAEGYTLHQIGEQFGVTRERIRQILRKYTTLKAEDGGAAIKAKRRRAEAAGRFFAKYGISREEYRELKKLGAKLVAAGIHRDRTPIGAYNRQKCNSKTRGIEWKFNFGQWWSVWEQSGKWDLRGRGQGYAMCRRGDIGPYSPDNVFIGTSRENSSRPDTKKTGLPMGVSCRGSRYQAKRCINGKMHWLGAYSTPELAHAAYLASMPEAA